MNSPSQKFFEIRELLKQLGVIKIIGFIEVLIGTITLVNLLVNSSLRGIDLGVNIFTFIAMTGTISTLLGVGILRHNRLAYELLLYFSSVIILSKFLILADILHLNGALDHTVPSIIKSWISILYHGFVIYYFTLSHIHEKFPKEDEH